VRRFGSIRLSALLACGVVAAGCGGSETNRATTATKLVAPVSPDGMTSQRQKARRDACRKLVLVRTPPGPARQRGLAACALNTRYP
jgi:hypothetical protein